MARRDRHAPVRGDTIAIAARQVTVEEGRVDWAPGLGLLRRVRHIVVETSVPAGGPVRQALRSRLEQEVSWCGWRAELWSGAVIEPEWSAVGPGGRDGHYLPRRTPPAR